MERHTWIGYQILAGSGSALLELGATIALTHHEKWDGTRLPAAARRAAPSRWRDRSRRSRTCSTRSPATGPTARRSRSRRPCEIMRDERGKHFDPRLIDLFFENVDQLLEIRDRHTPPLVTPDPPVVVA